MPNFVQYYKTKYVNAELSITERSFHGGGALVLLCENHTELKPLIMSYLVKWVD